MAENADAKTAPKPPPNLRVSEEEGRECDSCVHYQRGRCAKYNHLPVDGEWVCDSYEKGRADPDDEAPSKAKNLQGAERDAYRRVRSARDQADEKSEK